MQGNRDGSWSLRASANDGYFPQANRVFSSFSIHQPIRYNFQTPQQNLNFPRPQFGAGANVEVSRIDNAFNKTRKSLVAAGENVSSTRVSQLVLAQLQADSWRSLGMQIQDVPSFRQLMVLEGKDVLSFIQDAKRQEGETLKILLTELHQKYRTPSPKKQQQDKDYCGKHTRFNPLSSEDNDSADYEVENVNSSDHFSSCPYPSIAEEIKLLGSSSKKRKAESCNHEKSDFHKLLRRDPSKLRRGHAKQETPKLADNSDAKQVFSVNEADFTLSEGALRLFVSTWKDTCKELSMSMKELVTEALEEQIPTEITDASLVAGYDDCAGTSSKANKPKPSRAMSMKSGSTSGNLVHEWNNSISTDFSAGDHQLHTSTAWAAQAQQTGRKGEEIAYRYFAAKYGKKAQVRWVNEQRKQGYLTT